MSISSLSLHKYNVKWPNFKIIRERERQGDNFLLSVCELGRGGINQRGNCHQLSQDHVLLSLFVFWIIRVFKSIYSKTFR